jgi:hypothetical protein
MLILKSFVGRRRTVAKDISSNKGMWSSSQENRPPSVVTSTLYDDDNYFHSVAQALLFRFESEGLTERGAILATLVTTEDKRSFLESLDLRSCNMYSNMGEGEVDLTGINEIVERVRSTLGESLRLLWREAVTGYDQQSYGISTEGDLSVDQQIDDRPYHRPLQTPKNLYSPIESINNELNNTCSLMPKSSGRQRRQFFPDNSDQPRLRPRLIFEFKIGSRDQAHHLRLDGQSSDRGYTPPSPIAMHI